ncbi:GNAT family N-acetyltransferase [Tropicimonas marinistellae]|uniref:GNAT family N-acetyltransferase n=1 Tax=Tropicimonas marinistellae TaxID=1739787 RepID=UPI001372B64B|nr:GNAT family N-acetyltransferase [Tropicimonas marinistellae]
MTDAIRYHVLNKGNASQLLGADVFDNAVDDLQLATFLDDPGHELVFATVRDKVVGFASGNVLLHPDKQPAFFINEVGVNADMRRRGIGTSLCECLIEIARDRGCKGIWLATEMENEAARALYRGIGGRETEHIVVYDWDGAMDP